MNTNKEPLQGLRRHNPKGWGKVEIGDQVTSFGRHGAGQPAVDGQVVSIERDLVTIYDRHAKRNFRRSISNVRKIGA